MFSITTTERPFDKFSSFSNLSLVRFTRKPLKIVQFKPMPPDIIFDFVLFNNSWLFADVALKPIVGYLPAVPQELFIAAISISDFEIIIP